MGAVIANVGVTICLLIVAFCVFMLIKNEIAFRNQTKIAEAIWDYVMDSENFAEGDRLIDSIESYHSTLWRLYDFGCKNILPKADYELIKPYIK